MATKSAKPAATAAAAKTAKTTTAVAVAKAGNIIAPSDVKALIAQQIAEIQGGALGQAGGDVIAISQDKNFKLPDGTVTGDPLDLIIVDFVSANSFYEGAYNPNDIQPPGCYAVHKIIDQMVPTDKSPNQQASNCATCPMNQFGSAGSGKACKNSRLLAVLPADFDDDTPLWVIKVSPTALKNFDKYVSSLARNGILPSMVKTVVDFNPAESYAQLMFTDPQPLDEEVIARVFARQAEAKERLAQLPDFSTYGQTKPKAAPRGKVAPRPGARTR